MRFREAHVRATRDGLPWRNLSLHLFESWIMQLCRRFSIQKVINPISFLPVFRKTTQKAIESGAGMGCITVQSENPLDLVNAGRMLLRTWCQLNQNGYGVQLYFLEAMSVYDLFTNALPTDIKPDYRSTFLRGWSTLKNAFHFSDSEIPIMMFRTDRTSPLPHRTMRRPLSDVFHLQDQEKEVVKGADNENR